MDRLTQKVFLAGLRRQRMLDRDINLADNIARSARIFAVRVARCAALQRRAVAARTVGGLPAR